MTGSFHELHDIERLSRLWKPYALFLRSFDAEKAGLQDSNTQLTHQANEDQYAIDLAGTLPPWQDHSNAWTLQSALVSLLGKRLQAVQLGDHPSLDERLITSALLRDRVIRIKTDDETWWAAFELLARQARLTVVFADLPSPSLVKELAHLRSHRLNFVCVQKEGTLGTGGDHTIVYQEHGRFDFSGFKRMLDDALNS